MLVEIPVWVGKLIDKVTILRIKATRIVAERRANVVHELALLEAIVARAVLPSPALAALTEQLESVNAAVWEIEEGKRDRERRGAFGAEFVALARSVYRQNARRADIKRRINLLVGSEIVEEKSYGA